MTRVDIAQATLAITAALVRARLLFDDTLDCRECRGTGGDPECRTCKGYHSVRLPRLYALGWKKADLQDVDESDGYAECPSCDGHRCDFCQSEGTLPFYIQNQQERRALIFARYQKMPPTCEVHYWNGRRRWHYEHMLSVEAAGYMIEAGTAMRLNSVFGHEFYLTAKSKYPVLWREARKRARAAAAQRYGI